MPIKLSVAPQQFVDEAGKPIAGRVTFYKHDSNELATVYRMQDNSFVLAQNPQLLNAMGALDETVFFDADILDMKVERYIGAPGGMNVLSPDFASFDKFQVGMDYKAILEQAGTVADIAELKQVDPAEFKAVQVQDIPWRVYVWDELATNNADDGIVVQSDVTGDGRWLLMWDDEMLPSSIYGVADGNYANLTACLSYPEVVGSIGLKTPQVVRIVPGTYNTTTWVSTTKTIAFGKNTQFTGGGIICPMARQVSDIDDYFCDLEFTDPNAEAHSSWFRTAVTFLACGAPRMFIGQRSYFADNTITTQVTVQDKEIIALAELPFTFVNSGRIRFDKCTFVGTGFIPTSAKVTFVHTDFKEDWFSGNYVSFDFVNNTVVRTTGQNSIRLENFRNVGAYIKCIEADGQTDLDLAGRYSGTISTSVLRTFRNVSCNTLNVTATGANVEFRNVSCQNVNISAWNLTVHDSAIKFGSEPTLNGLFCFYSDVASQYAVTGMSMACTFENCRVGMSFSRGSDNTTRDGALTFRECTFYTHGSISSKNISMYGCVTDDANIKVYPYHDGSNYRIFARFIGNTFVNSNPVEFTKVDQDEVYECLADWTVLDNSFTGNDEGLRCRYWSNRTGSYFNKVFIMPDERSVIVYGGNSGKCPAENMKGAGIGAGDTPLRTVDIGGGNNLYAYNRKKRCCPKFNVPDSGTTTQKLYRVGAAQDDNMAAIVDNQNSQNMRNLNGMYYWAYDDVWNDRNGDLFQLGLCIWVTQLDSHWGVSII